MNQIIGSISATDADEIDEVFFAIDQNPHLLIDQETGDLKIKKTFDFEEGFHLNPFLLPLWALHRGIFVYRKRRVNFLTITGKDSRFVFRGRSRV